MSFLNETEIKFWVTFNETDKISPTEEDGLLISFDNSKPIFLTKENRVFSND
jgi:hypothetical protein